MDEKEMMDPEIIKGLYDQGVRLLTMNHGTPMICLLTPICFHLANGN